MSVCRRCAMQSCHLYPDGRSLPVLCLSVSRDCTLKVHYLASLSPLFFKGYVLTETGSGTETGLHANRCYIRGWAVLTRGKISPFKKKKSLKCLKGVIFLAVQQVACVKAMNVLNSWLMISIYFHPSFSSVLVATHSLAAKHSTLFFS